MAAFELRSGTQTHVCGMMLKPNTYVESRAATVYYALVRINDSMIIHYRLSLQRL
jgi:hypothetical protein